MAESNLTFGNLELLTSTLLEQTQLKLDASHDLNAEDAALYKGYKEGIEIALILASKLEEGAKPTELGETLVVFLQSLPLELDV